MRSARAARALVSVTLAVAVLLVPASSFAKPLATDRIAGIPLETSGLEEVAPDVDAIAGLVVAEDGRILWARSAEQHRAVASITKIMTGLLTLEKADLDDEVTVSRAASRTPYAIGLQGGEKATVRQLLEYALVASSNDAAISLAEHVGGTLPAFVKMMNERAADLGLEDTHFANPHGLDTDGHYSSASDINALARIAMQIPEFRRIVALEDVTLPAREGRSAKKIESTDELLGVYDGLFGTKTGFTDDAKYCFVGTAERDGITLTTVVLGARNNEARFKETARLLDWGFEHLVLRAVTTTTETVGAVPISANRSREATVGFVEATSTPVFDLGGEIVHSLSLDASVDLPVYEGQPLGEVRLMQGEYLLMTVPVVATEDIASAEETVGAVPVSDYLDRTVIARATSEQVPVPEFDPDADVLREVILETEVKAPVEQGDKLGEIVYTQRGVIIVRVPVVAVTTVEPPGLLEKFGIWFARTWRWITGEPTMAKLQLEG